MDKFFEAIVETLRDFAKSRLPTITRFFDRLFALKDLLLTHLALLLRRSGERSILVVCILASLWSGFLFFGSLSAPNTPKPTHDAILKARFSSPEASKEVVILDIDERSIATLSESQGRWPWPRQVLADGLQKLEEAGVEAVVFNVLLSEPDKQNLESDATMEIAAGLFRPAGFPIVRLAKENDKLSELRAADLPGAEVSPGLENQLKLAVILPIFPSMHDRLGVTNQRPDADGIIRKYPFRWVESGFSLPSVLEVTLAAAEREITQPPDLFAINWRNKRGGYRRISFSDLYLGQLDAGDLEAIKGAIVVLGVSAPGIGQTKATGIAPVVDDSEILATALDDVLGESHLRLPPAWVLLLLNLASIWALFLVFSRKSAKSPPINRIFVILQAFLAGVTLLSASYTFYLVDLTDSMKLALGVFGAIKLVQNFDLRWSRAKKGYRRLLRPSATSHVVVAAFLEDSLTEKSETALQNDFERLLTHDRVIRIDDLMGGESFLKSYLSKCRVLLLCANSVEEESAIRQYLADAKLSPVHIESFSFDGTWNPEDKAFSKLIAPMVIDAINNLLRPPAAELQTSA